MLQRTAELDSQALLSQFVPPSRRKGDTLKSPRPDPCKVILAVPDVARLVGCKLLRGRIPKLRAWETDPTLLPNETETARLDRILTAILQTKDESPTQSDFSHPVPLTDTAAEKSTKPKNEPTTVTETVEVEGVFERNKELKEMIFREYPRVTLPTFITLNAATRLPSVPDAPRHRTEVSACQNVFSQLVCPVRTPPQN